MTETAAVRPDRRARRGFTALGATVIAALGATTIAALAVTTTSTTATADAATPTHQVVVRPVTATGHAAAGWKVHTESRSVRCGVASRGAVDNGIAFCGSSTDYTVACWHSFKASRVLCLPDPTKKRLDSVVLSGRFAKVKAPRRPSPQAVRTVVGGYYLVRDGGAGPMLKHHSGWVADYFGVNNGRFIAGPRGTDGVNRRHATWFVTSFRTPDQRGTRQKLATAYFVGTQH